jgi:CubicO group peptidase (beta-lactamase class C family)
MDAITVLRNGRITCGRCKTMAPETTHNWFSSGKVISATLLSMLEHERKADLPKPVSCYLPQLK